MFGFSFTKLCKEKLNPVPESQRGDQGSMNTKVSSIVKEKTGLMAPVRSLDRQITAQDIDCRRQGCHE